MAKKAKSVKNKEDRTRKKFLIVLAVFIALALVIILGQAIYTDRATKSAKEDARLDAQDKRRFETVRGKVGTLHSRLQSIKDPEENWEIEARCREGSVKFGKGAIGCYIKTTANIEVASDTQARALINKYRTAFQQASDLFVYKEQDSSPDPSTFPADLADGYDGAGFRERETRMVCGSLFSIDDSGREREEAGIKERILKISFSCNSGARELHYPERTTKEILEDQRTL